MTRLYRPTSEQQKVIDHDGPAFISACPGAGKTRTLVERARRELNVGADRRGMAFLSFTNAAIEELEERLHTFSVMPVPLFPSYIGTFDSFLWQFLVAPFGIPDCDQLPRLVPDKSEWEVKPPYDSAQPLRLKCFDRATGRVKPALALEEGFDVAKRQIKAHESCALAIIENARKRGHVDFEDVRVCVGTRLADHAFAQRVGAALSMRFREIVVDEAQDCNPADLAIIDWHRNSGIAVKVICDPNQSIYEFRGGVADELQNFADTFDAADRLLMRGNFRSTPAICAATAVLRPPGKRTQPDEPLGEHLANATPVHILSYRGAGVSSEIGMKFRELVLASGIALSNAPVLAATRASAAKAVGEPVVEAGNHMTLLLAAAVANWHHSTTPENHRQALTNLHRVILLVQGKIPTLASYHTYLVDNEAEGAHWRPEIIALSNRLRFDPTETPTQWLDRARTVLAPSLRGPLTINQRLRAHADLSSALATALANMPPARTIHSAKGMEFPGVCVVLSTRTAGGILDLLEGKPSVATEEDVRKIYVAASRAERLLAIAVPKSQLSRLQTLLTNSGCRVEVHSL